MRADGRPCVDEREVDSERFTCGKDHCSTCGAHRVWDGPESWSYRCEIEGGCQVSLGAFA